MANLTISMFASCAASLRGIGAVAETLDSVSMDHIGYNDWVFCTISRKIVTKSVRHLMERSLNLLVV